MIEFVDGLLDDSLQDFEVDAHAAAVDAGGADRHPDLPVMAVGFFAISGVVAQVVGSGEVGIDENIKHPVLLRVESALMAAAGMQIAQADRPLSLSAECNTLTVLRHPFFPKIRGEAKPQEAAATG